MHTSIVFINLLKMTFLVHRLYKELQQDGSRAAFDLRTSFLRLALAAFTPALSSVVTVLLTS